MAEDKAGGVKAALTGWVKAGVTSIVGLVSGAMLMYLTPIVNNTIKPAKPIANFATQVAGLTVTFNNRSSGGLEGWWDFGDGSALEPYSPTQNVFTHTYEKPGTYNVKLSLHNLLREQSDRTVAINVDASTAKKPEIEHFEVTAITKDERAPAVYRLQSKVKNADFAILSYRDDRSLQIDDSSTNLERYFTFDEMGAYTIRLAAVNGKEIVEKTATVYVSPNEGVEPIAKLITRYQAVRVESVERILKVDPKNKVGPIVVVLETKGPFKDILVKVEEESTRRWKLEPMVDAIGRPVIRLQMKDHNFDPFRLPVSIWDFQEGRVFRGGGQKVCLEIFRIHLLDARIEWFAEGLIVRALIQPYFGQTNHWSPFSYPPVSTLQQGFP